MSRYSEALEWYSKALAVAGRVDSRAKTLTSATTFFGVGESMVALGKVRSTCHSLRAGTRMRAYVLQGRL